MRLCVGIFVGGKGTRLGGVAKGLLPLASGERVIERLVSECRAALPASELLLIGDAGRYAELALGSLCDVETDIGPLGGLCALLEHAERTALDAVLALACDLPYLSRTLLSRLAEEAPHAAALAPRSDGRWEALCARYARGASTHVRAALAARQHSLQGVFARIGAGAAELELEPGERAQLSDWDTPADLRRAAQKS